MENIWGPQRKTGNMEEESLREENRKAHEEDERFRMTAVKAAGQVRQRMRCATGESDEVIRRKFMLPERYILTLMTVETLGQERMLLDLMAGGRLGADLVLCGRRSFYADMLLRTARDRRLALRTNFIYEYSPEELSAFFRMADGLVYLPRKRGRVQPVVEALYAGIPAVLSDTRRNRLTAGDAARYIACPELDELADTLDAILSDSGLRRQVQGCCLRRVERWKTTDDNLRTRE